MVDAALQRIESGYFMDTDPAEITGGGMGQVA
jgi:hypothetical protein